MNKYLIFFAVLLFSSISFSQGLKYNGAFEQGNLVIAKGNNIEWAWLNEVELKIDNAKVFTFGFDAKETGNKILKVKHDDGKVSLKKFKLPARKYRVQRINNTKQQFSETPDSLKQRITKEREISNIAKSEIGKTDTAFYNSGFMLPIKGGRISSVFGSQRVLNGVYKNMHNGIDIAVPRGTPVFAMADGIVRLNADDFYYAGNHIILDHGQGLNSLYLHLSESFVKENQHVKKGDIIGRVGTTGRSTGPHLHWGVQWYSKRVDPAQILTMKFR
ncbi:MAG: M23 family metallopeptidase [Melioribacteraceae bacterium]|jgi:murein DD-endopeptidase MepM/ murein hydrolase activator NlpD|nr:M23 family metallopeptidase [Melioribacteraceae bacterium]